MRVYLAVKGRGDLTVDAGPTVTVGQLVGALLGTAATGGQSLVVERSGAVLDPDRALFDLDVRSGDTVRIVELGPDTRLATGPDVSAEPEAALRMLTGPRAGETYRLPEGTSSVGRTAANDVVILDPGVSRRHATITVDASAVVVRDRGSTNGTVVDGRSIDGPTPVFSGQRILLGQSWVAVDHFPGPVIPVQGRVLFDRPARAVKRYQGRTIQVPAPPELPTGGRRRAAELLSGPRHQHRQLVDGYEATIDASVAELDQNRRIERDLRLRESPSFDDVVAAVRARTRLWERRPGDPDVLEVRLGLAELPSRSRVEVAPGGSPELRHLVDRLPRHYATVDGVPATFDLARPGGLTIRGPRELRRSLAYALVGQLVGLNGPDQLGVLFLGDETTPWDWLKWLPHTNVAGLGHTPAGLESRRLVDRYLSAERGGGPDLPHAPTLVAIVDGHCSALERLVAEGPKRGIHPLVLADAVSGRSPAGAARAGTRPPATVTIDGPLGRLRADPKPELGPIALESCSQEAAADLARLVAPIVLQPPPPARIADADAAAALSVDPLRLGRVEPSPRRGPAPSADSGPAGSAVPTNPTASAGPADRAVAADPTGSAGPAGRAVAAASAPPPASSAPAPAPAPSPESSPGAPSPVDLTELPRPENDSRLVLGTVHMSDRSAVAVFAFNPARDGSLGLVGGPGSGKSESLRTVAAAAALLDLPAERLPQIYALAAGRGLDTVASLPLVAGAASGDPHQVRDLLIEIEQLLADRLLTFELAGADSLDDFRRLRPAVTLRRVLVLVDDLGGLTSAQADHNPARVREVVGQLLEIGSGLGVHVVFSTSQTSDLDPLLVPKVGRWLDFGPGGSDPGRAVVGSTEVRFATVGRGDERGAEGFFGDLAAVLVDRGLPQLSRHASA